MSFIQEPELRCQSREWNMQISSRFEKPSQHPGLAPVTNLPAHPHINRQLINQISHFFFSFSITAGHFSQQNNLSKQERSPDWEALPVDWAPGKHCQLKRKPKSGNGWAWQLPVWKCPHLGVGTEEKRKCNARYKNQQERQQIVIPALR